MSEQGSGDGSHLPEWPFREIALPRWIRVEKFRPFGNLIAVHGRCADGIPGKLTAADFGAIIRFAMLCHPSTPWQNTVVLVAKEDAEVEHRLKELLQDSWDARVKREARHRKLVDGGAE